ncbi:MAG: DinB family protein [Paracoccaceae bacterium]
MSGAAAHPYLRMALNNAWANNRFFNALADLPPGAFTAPAPGFFPSLCRTLNHIHEVDLYYIDALEEGGLGRSVYDRSDETDPAALAAAQAEADRRLVDFCRRQNVGITSASRRCERPGGIMTEERVDALLLHLFQHQVHHRGQAHVQLQALGVAPPQLDEFHLDHDRHPSAEAFFA